MLSTAQLLNRVNNRPTLEKILRNNVIHVDFKAKEIKKALTSDLYINPHFVDYINDWDSYYYMIVGGYGSSKSFNTAYKILLKLIKEKRTCLVVREVFDTHKDSTFSLFQDIIENNSVFKSVCVCKQSPLSIRFLNGSKIIFKGMDKPEKLKSIHNITMVWIEECSEVKYEGFKEIVGRLRHPTLPLHIILTTNPVSKSNWCYKRFFVDKKVITLDDEKLYKERVIRQDNTYYHHSLADDNYFLPQSYIKQLDDMKKYDPDLYRVARQGRFGINGTKVLPQFEVIPHYDTINRIRKLKKKTYRVGMDFGFESSYNAVIRMCIDDEKKELYIYYEYYKNHMTDDRTAIELQEFKDSQELIRADSAEPKTIAYYQQEGFRMIPAKKFKGSRLQNTKKMKRFRKIYCSADCVNVIDELSELTYKMKNGEIVEDEFNIDPHTLSAIWYGLDGYEVSDLKDRNYTVYDKGTTPTTNRNKGKGGKIIF